MPIYEYKCKKCGKVFEHLARNADDAPASCAHCGAAELEKQFSAFAINMGGTAGAAMPEKCGSCPSAGACPYMDDDY